MGTVSPMGRRLYTQRTRGRDPRTPRRALASLSRSPDAFVRAAVAGNPAASPRILARLASDSSPIVQPSVAANPSTPASALALLAETDLRNAAFVASNPSASEPTLNLLAQHTELLVRQRVASNPSASWDLLARMARADVAAGRIARSAGTVLRDRMAALVPLTILPLAMTFLLGDSGAPEVHRRLLDYLDRVQMLPPAELEVLVTLHSTCPSATSEDLLAAASDTLRAYSCSCG